MKKTRADIPSVLEEAGILAPGAGTVADEALAGSGGEERSPWYIHALVVAGAWVAALLFTAFFFGSLLSGVHNKTVYLAVGLLVCGGCALAMRVVPANRFAVQFALALGIAGQLLFGYGAAGAGHELFAAALAVAALNAAVIPLARQRLQTFLSVVLIAGGLLVAIWDLKWWQATNVLIIALGAGVLVLWEYRPFYARRSWRPAGYAMAAAFLGVLHLSLLPGSAEFGYYKRHISWWISSAGLLIILGLLIIRIAAGRGRSATSRPVMLLMAGAAVLVGTTLNSPGIPGALLVLGLGYQRRERLLTGIAAVFTAVFLSAYYYYLDLSLLEKSAALAASGAALLIFRQVLLWRVRTGEAADA